MILPNHPRMRFALIVLSFWLFMGAIFGLTLLANDVFTVPYLTPVAHFIKMIITPFLPFFAPLGLGAFIKVWRSKEMKELGIRPLWLFTTGMHLNNNIMWVWPELANLYVRPNASNGISGGWCKIGKCGGGYFQAALLVGVVFAEWRGWKWEGGLMDKLIAMMCEESRKTKATKEADGMEKGSAADEKVAEYHDEKKVEPTA